MTSGGKRKSSTSTVVRNVVSDDGVEDREAGPHPEADNAAAARGGSVVGHSDIQKRQATTREDTPGSGVGGVATNGAVRDARVKQEVETSRAAARCTGGGRVVPDRPLLTDYG